MGGGIVCCCWGGAGGGIGRGERLSPGCFITGGEVNVEGPWGKDTDHPSTFIAD